MADRDEFAALRAALDALNAECAKLAGDIRRPPETAEISAHLAFMRECKPDVIGRLLAAAEERDRLQRTLSDHLLSEAAETMRADKERARAERLAAALEHLIERCDTSDDMRYGTISTAYVREIATDALAAEPEETT